MYAFAVFACPLSIKTFSTTSWMSSTFGILLAYFSSKTFTTSLDNLSAILLSRPPTSTAAAKIALVTRSWSKSTILPSRLHTFLMIAPILNSDLRSRDFTNKAQSVKVSALQANIKILSVRGINLRTTSSIQEIVLFPINKFDRSTYIILPQQLCHSSNSLGRYSPVSQADFFDNLAHFDLPPLTLHAWKWGAICF